MGVNTTESPSMDRPGVPASRPAAPAEQEPTRYVGLLVLWMAMVVGLNGVLWITGFRERGLAIAVEEGAARAERQRIGEVEDDVIREAIRLQQDTRPFWMALVLLGDFVFEPALLAGRAIAVATAFAALAALTGRPIGFERGLHAAAAAQGVWVFGLAVRVGLMIALKRPDVDTSVALALPPGTYPALIWLSLRQADAFALSGWAALAWGGWRRGQVNLVVAVLICGLMALAEAACRIGAEALIGSGMRLTVLPA